MIDSQLEAYEQLRKQIMWENFGREMNPTDAAMVEMLRDRARQRLQAQIANLKQVEEETGWLKDMNTFLDKSLPTRKPLLWDKETNGVVFYGNSLNQMFAFRGLGKSLTSIALVKVLAEGGDFLRLHSDGGARVLIVDGELPQQQLQERFAQFIGKSERVKFMSPETMPKGENFPILSVVEDQKKFLHQIAGFKPNVILIDSVTRCFRFDTNDSDAWQVVNNFLLDLRFLGYCVILVHHAGKGGTQRGRSDGDDNLDVSIKLAPPSGWSPGDGLEFEWMYEKVRHAGILPSFTAKLKDGSWVLQDDPLEDDIKARLMKKQSIRRVAAELDIAASKVWRYKRKLEEDAAI